ncbi:MAG: sodium/glutamate symporter [Chlorobi bacterium]|nr:sodium/glutamate symporter [Chlorobiota bacterium]
MELDPRQTIITGILVLFLGKYLNRKIQFLQQFNIPEAVTGGIIASLFFGILVFFNIDITFSPEAKHYRDVLLVIFFTAIGLSTDFKNIIKGGKILLLLSILAIAYIFIQNYIGVFIARLFGYTPAAGILVGSVALQGGHGNVVSWEPVLKGDYGVSNAMEIGMIMATFGLVLGGILGGPFSRFMINKYKLKPDEDSDIVTIGTKIGKNLTIDYNSSLMVLLMLSLSIGLGIQLNNLVSSLGFTLPLFVTCMFGGVLLVNIVPYIIPKLKCPTNSPTLSVVSDLSLGLFLAMAMMALKFWELGSESLFIAVSVVVQVVSILLFTYFIMFRILGKNYASAVISAGYIGSALGATPTAMANMAAVTQKYGPSPVAFAVIPIVGAFIIQISNAIVIKIILMLFY